MTTRTSPSRGLALGALGLVTWLGCGDGDNPSTPDAPPATDAALPDSASPDDPLAGIGTVELVASGYQFTEGPQWRDTEADLLFTDIPANRIYRYVPGGGAPTVFREPSSNANGLALDAAGVLHAAEHGSRTVTRTGAAQPIAARFEAKRLNSPNDLVIADDGTVYFTDPPYGLPNGTTPELDFMGVFRIAPGGELTAEYRGPLASRPNGIGLSPDGRTAYVADTADGGLYRWGIRTNGALAQRTLHAQTAGSPDGLAIDEAGNIFVTTTAGVEVFSPTGQRWGAIPVPMRPSNCAFGDADHRTLYITARSAVYRVRLAKPGLPRR